MILHQAPVDVPTYRRPLSAITETLTQIPALITHRIVPKGVQESLGIPRDLVRVAVGIEPTGELLANFKQALKEL